MKCVSTVQLLVLQKRDRRYRAVSVSHGSSDRMKALLQWRDILEKRSLTFALPSNRIVSRWNVRDCNVSRELAAQRYTIPTILMHRQSLCRIARISNPVIANPREREREILSVSILLWEESIPSLLSSPLQFEIMSDETMHLLPKPLLYISLRHECVSRFYAFRTIEFNQKNWFNSVIHQRYLIEFVLFVRSPFFQTRYRIHWAYG